MTDPRDGKSADVPLNPALKSKTDATYDTERVTPAPIDTASSKGGGEAWPIAWLVITVVCIAFAVYFLVI